MSKVIATLAVSVDGFISGNEPVDSDGAVVCGHASYVHSGGFASAGASPDVPLVVLSRGEIPELNEDQALAHTIEDAVALARELAGDKDVGLIGAGVVTSALSAGLLDEIVLDQLPVLLGAGRSFGELPAQVDLELAEVVAGPGVTHLRYEVVR